MTLRWPDAERVDAARVDAGVLYCPVCRRPTAAGSLTGAAQLLARHLDESHDPVFGALIRVYLRPPVAGATAAPFYPQDTEW